MVLEVQERGTDILASGESLVLCQLMEESAKIRRCVEEKGDGVDFLFNISS
jgi:hypothetical protein